MTENNIYPFVNIPLPFGNDALMPYIDEKTMMLHHDKHLQTYINNLNAALEKEPRLQQLPLLQLIEYSEKLPQPLQNAIKNNGGGVYNHRFYFDQLKYRPNGKPTGELLRAIDGKFGSFDKFKAELKAAALSVFGSGYAWLVANGNDLEIVSTPNQNVPTGVCLLLNVDVWEHAYYLKHKNVRADYFDDLMNVIDWNKVEERYRDRANAE